MKRILPIAAALLMASALVAQESGKAKPKEEAMTLDKFGPGLYAVLDTEKGRIICRFFEKEAPKTVKNFTDLAEGKKEWKDPLTGEKKKTRFYDGLTFMRVIPGFMIQGGDPLNNCTGGPGYKFEDEFSSALKFDKPGLLAMANAGPNTNGSQFFITDDPRGHQLPSHLNNKHTIFGVVVEGMSVVSAIADVPANGGIAVKPVAIKSVKIERVEAKKPAPAK